MKFVIRGNNWKVKKLSVVKDDEGNLCDGICDYDKKSISVNKNLKEPAMIDTLVHEFLHAAIDEMHLDLGAIADEMVVRGLTESLLQNFKISIKKPGPSGK